MSFFGDLRDDTAGPLIAQFGQVGAYRVYGSETYDNATGKTTKGAATDTPIVLLDLPMKERVFSEDVTVAASAILLIAAKELNTAGVTPSPENFITFGTTVAKILAINTVGPSGEAVIYKMAVAAVVEGS